jgi:hypothetical protein
MCLKKSHETHFLSSINYLLMVFFSFQGRQLKDVTFDELNSLSAMHTDQQVCLLSSMTLSFIIEKYGNIHF